MSVVLVVDIGNTSTSVAAAVDGDIRDLRFRKTCLIATQRAVRRFIGPLLRHYRFTGSVLASVVPARNAAWMAVLGKDCGSQLILVNDKTRLGVALEYSRPETIGADRLANACAAVARYGAPTIVADFGTAVTFDIISKKPAYIGGVIAPGLPLMSDYLYDRTALLPKVDLHGSIGSIGRSTEEAMRIGAKVGYRGMVREIVGYLQRGLGKKPAHLIATGGYARWALEGLDMPFTIALDLTLYGLSRIYDLNKQEIASQISQRE